MRAAQWIVVAAAVAVLPVTALLVWVVGNDPGAIGGPEHWKLLPVVVAAFAALVNEVALREAAAAEDRDGAAERRRRRLGHGAFFGVAVAWAIVVPW